MLLKKKVHANYRSSSSRASGNMATTATRRTPLVQKNGEKKKEQPKNSPRYSEDSLRSMRSSPRPTALSENSNSLTSMQVRMGKRKHSSNSDAKRSPSTSTKGLKSSNKLSRKTCTWGHGSWFTDYHQPELISPLPMVENAIGSKTNVKGNGRRKKENARSLEKETKGPIQRKDTIKRDLQRRSFAKKSLQKIWRKEQRRGRCLRP